MLKKTITFEDFFGDTRTEDFFFNISKAEMVKLELSEDGGLEAKLSRLVQKRDVPAMMEEFDRIIGIAYGEVSPDGKRFIKTDENGKRLFDSFKETDAYSVLFLEMFNDPDAFPNFLHGIIPKDLMKEFEKNLASVKDDAITNNVVPIS